MQLAGQVQVEQRQASNMRRLLGQLESAMAQIDIGPDEVGRKEMQIAAKVGICVCMSLLLLWRSLR